MIASIDVRPTDGASPTHQPSKAVVASGQSERTVSILARSLAVGMVEWRHERLAGDEARAAAVREEAPRPADEDDEAVREPHQGRDVDAQPERPREDPALASQGAEPADVRDAREPP